MTGVFPHLGPISLAGVVGFADGVLHSLREILKYGRLPVLQGQRAATGKLLLVAAVDAVDIRPIVGEGDGKRKLLIRVRRLAVAVVRHLFRDDKAARFILIGDRGVGEHRRAAVFCDTAPVAGAGGGVAGLGLLGDVVHDAHRKLLKHGGLPVLQGQTAAAG